MSDFMDKVVAADNLSVALAKLQRNANECAQLYTDYHKDRVTHSLDSINPKLVALKTDLEDFAELVPEVGLVSLLTEEQAKALVKALAKLLVTHNLK